MHTVFRPFVAASLAAFLIAAIPAHSQAEPRAKAVADYTVFVDPPTGFVFVKLPTGWKFVGKVDSAQVDRLPAGVVTALLSDDGHQVSAHAANVGNTSDQ